MPAIPKFSIDRQTGLLQPARYFPSPNFNQRPTGIDIDLLVIHNISLPPGEFGGDGIDRLFTNQLDAAEHPYYEQIHNMQVSSHLLIRRDGEVVQYVSFNDRAWHAGRSEYQGRNECNDFAIGIELEGTDDIPYEEAQYLNLAGVTNGIMQVYPIGMEHITGHSDIAPGRKTDPGPVFDWAYYKELLKNNE